MSRVVKPLRAGEAADRIRAKIAETIEEAEEAREAVMAKIPERVRAIAQRVQGYEERELLEQYLSEADHAPGELFHAPAAIQPDEPIPHSLAIPD